MKGHWFIETVVFSAYTISYCNTNVVHITTPRATYFLFQLLLRATKSRGNTFARGVVIWETLTQQLVTQQYCTKSCTFLHRKIYQQHRTTKRFLRWKYEQQLLCHMRRKNVVWQVTRFVALVTSPFMKSNCIRERTLNSVLFVFFFVVVLSTTE